MSETHDQPHGKRAVNYISGENILNLTNMRGSRYRIPFISEKKGIKHLNVSQRQ